MTVSHEQQVTLPAGYSLIRFVDIDSTNDAARRMLADNEIGAGAVLWAQSQSGGHGRRGNGWVSPPGNLYVSFVLKPDVPVACLGQLAFVAAIAMAETVAKFVAPDTDISLKWPNDLLLNGKKAAGILLETEITAQQELAWIIMGVGINVAHAPDYAVALRDFCSDAETGAVLEKFCACFDDLYRQWQTDGFTKIRAAWLDRAAGLGERIIVRLPRDEMAGIFRALDENGALVLQRDDGSEQCISSGDVFFEEA